MERGFFAPKRSDANYTHLLYSGGRLIIPDDENKRMLEKMAEDVMYKKPVYVSEQRSTVFKMFMDVEYHSESEVTQIEVLKLVEGMQKCILRFFPNTDVDVNKLLLAYVLKADTKKEKLPGVSQELTKYGFHVIFPNLRVDSEMALMLRESLKAYA